MPTNTLAKQKRINNIVDFVKDNIDFFIAPLENQEPFAQWIQAYPDMIALSNQLIDVLENSTQRPVSVGAYADALGGYSSEQLNEPRPSLKDGYEKAFRWLLAADDDLLPIFEKYNKQQNIIDEWHKSNYKLIKNKLKTKIIALYNTGDTLSQARAIAADNVLTSVDKAYQTKDSDVTTKQATNVMKATINLINNPTTNIQSYKKIIKPFIKSKVSETKQISSAMLGLLGVCCLGVIPVLAVATAGVALPISMGLGLVGTALISTSSAWLASAKGAKHGAKQRLHDTCSLWSKGSNTEKVAREITCSQVLRGC